MRRILASYSRSSHWFNAEAPAELCDLIHHCLTHKAHNRPERMSDVATVLDELTAKLVNSSADKLEALEW